MKKKPDRSSFLRIGCKFAELQIEIPNLRICGKKRSLHFFTGTAFAIHGLYNTFTQNYGCVTQAVAHQAKHNLASLANKLNEK
jgi:hypothetical protein